ncbi:hypothetical protein CASFOL_009744 [Castilleja foliolosa]|uniref:RNA polymerase Rpb5 N-terminal domain-containing protein n=1 Tax=Castilleja foliolosa TaxID=1961234 RepID=A0ABD3DRP8_9LAMI
MSGKMKYLKSLSKSKFFSFLTPAPKLLLTPNPNSESSSIIPNSSTCLRAPRLAFLLTFFVLTSASPALSSNLTLIDVSSPIMMTSPSDRAAGSEGSRLEMLKDRGFAVPSCEIEVSLEEFRNKHGGTPDADDLRISALHKDDPSIKAMVIFCGQSIVKVNTILRSVLLPEHFVLLQRMEITVQQLDATFASIMKAQ